MSPGALSPREGLTLLGTSLGSLFCWTQVVLNGVWRAREEVMDKKEALA